MQFKYQSYYSLLESCWFRHERMTFFQKIQAQLCVNRTEAMERQTALSLSTIFPEWIQQHSDLQPWEQGFYRLERQLSGAAKTYSEELYDFPTNLPQTESWVLLEPKLYSCWFYHWEKKDSDLDAQEALKYVEESLNFKPLKELVFCDAFYARQNAAAMYYHETFGPYLRRIGGKLLQALHLFGDAEDVWLNDFYIYLLKDCPGKDPVIQRFMGMIPLRNWLAVVFTNYVNNQRRCRKGRKNTVSIEENELEFPSRTSEPSSLEVSDSSAARLLTFVTESVKTCFGALFPDEQMRLRFRHEEDLSNLETAEILKEHPSVTSRKRTAAEGKMEEEMKKCFQNSSEFSCFYDAFFSRSCAEDFMQLLFGGNDD